MFENKSQAPIEISDLDFIIVCDKFTHPMAVSLRNTIGKDNSIKCAVWSPKDYKANEVKLSSKNHLILLDEDMINECLANPKLKPEELTEDVFVKVEVNTIGIYVSSVAKSTSFKEMFKQSWKKYLLSLLLERNILPLLLLKKDKKRIKFRLLFDAINKLNASKIKELYNRG